MSGSAVVVRFPQPRSPEAEKFSKEGASLYASGRYTEAQQAFDRSHQAAIRDSDRRSAVRALGNIGNCELVRFSYQRAMAAYLEAKRQAEQIGDTETLLNAQVNIAHIYGAMGDYRKAVATDEKILTRFGSAPNRSRAYIYLHLGNVTQRLGEPEKLAKYFRLSAEEAARVGDTKLQAMALDHFGLALLDRGDPLRAEPLFKEALALRQKRAPDEVALSHRSLGVLYSRLNRPSEALPYLDQAIASQKANLRKTPIYELYGERAAVRAAMGDPDHALADYRTAFDYVRRWRLEVLPSGFLPAHWEGNLKRLRSSFIRFAVEQAIQRKDSALALEALVAAEESRLASLRAVSSSRSSLPPEYHQTLQKMQNAEASLLADPRDPAALRSQIQRLQTELLEMETRARLAGQLPSLPPDTPNLARSIIDRLRPDEAILSFFVDEPGSYVWELTRGQIRVHRLPGRKYLDESIARFRDELTGSDPSHLPAGKELHSRIFGEISPEASGKQIWTIVLDDRLFELPLAGLPIARGKQQEEYLVERHTFRTAPSLFLAAEAPPPGGTEFLGVGDPIYNRADSRATASPGHPGAAPLQLPRLLGSAAEVDSCARSWDGPTEVLKGAAANLQSLATALRKPVRVVHFATHFVRSQEDSSRTMIALGLGPEGKSHELLGAEQIAALQANADLVVLSGCQSGAGQTISGTGLLGLTRAWLLGGAANVAASHWATPDDTGDIFLHFYRHYERALADRAPYAAARALRNAQLDMRRSSGWRNAPRYWAAFFLMSKG